MTLCFCRGMWWRRSWFSLKGKVGFQGQVRSKLLTSAHPAAPQAASMQHAGTRPTSRGIQKVEITAARAVDLRLPHGPSKIAMSAQTAAGGVLLDSVNAVGVEGEMTLDLGHGAVGRLVGPDRIH